MQASSEPANAEAPAFVLDAFENDRGGERQPGRVRLARGMVLVVAALLGSVLAIGLIALLLPSEGTKGQTQSVPRVVAPSTADPTPERRIRETRPTYEAYVPPRPVTLPPTRRAALTKRTRQPAPPVRLPCPFNWPVAREWCVLNGFAPPGG